MTIVRIFACSLTQHNHENRQIIKVVQNKSDLLETKDAGLVEFLDVRPASFLTKQNHMEKRKMRSIKASLKCIKYIAFDLQTTGEDKQSLYRDISFIRGGY